MIIMAEGNRQRKLRSLYSHLPSIQVSSSYDDDVVFAGIRSERDIILVYVVQQRHRASCHKNSCKSRIQPWRGSQLVKSRCLGRESRHGETQAWNVAYLSSASALTGPFEMPQAEVAMTWG